MKNNNLGKIEYITIIFVIIVLCSHSFLVYADQKTDLKNEQNNIEQQIEETNSEIAGVKSQMSETLSQINKYNAQIGSYEDEIVDLQSQIETLQTQITEKETDIQEQQRKFEEQQELLNKRLVAMYETGTTSYLEMLLSSDGLADFISKYYIIEQLTEYDNDLLKKIENTKKEIEKQKSELETSKNKVESSKTELENKRNSLTVLVSEKNTLVSSLSAEEQALEAELEEFEQDKRDIQNQLAAIAAQEEAARKEAERKAAEEARRKAEAAAASSSSVDNSQSSSTDTSTASSSPSSSGCICPLAGKSRANITTGYHGYSGHTGVDFACGLGTPIMAAKSGRVVISTALTRANGSYRSYGEYIVISHGDGTMTLYAHMSSRAVGVNAQVSQGQTIGYVGSTGNSTGPHLHFEVRVGGKCVNPTQYLP